MSEYFSVTLAYGERHASTASNIAHTADAAVAMAVRMVTDHGGRDGIHLTAAQVDELDGPWGRDDRVRFVRGAGMVCGQDSDFYVSVVRSGGQR